MASQERTNPVKYLFGMTWKYSRGNRKIVVLYLLLFCISEIVNSFWTPIVVAKMIGIVATQPITENVLKELFQLMLLYPFGSVISWMFHGPARYLEEKNAFMVRANYREHLLKGVMNMPLEWHNERHTGDIIDRIEKGATSIYDFSSETFQFFKPAVKLITCFGAVTYFSNVSAFIVIAIMLVGFAITVRIDKVCGQLIRELSRQENRLSESVHDAINNISTIITLRVEKLVFESVMHKVMKPFAVFKKNAALNESKWALTSFCCAIMTTLVFGAYFLQHSGTGVLIPAGSFYLIISYMDKISDLFYQFTSLYGWTIRRKFKLLNGDELSSEFKERSFANHVLPENWKQIKVSNLSFAYKSAQDDRLHLSELSFDINRGQTTAVVGGSGSGKSTLLCVIRDIFHKNSGEVAVDGVVVPEGFGGISRAISLVQQEPQILERTVGENITLGAEYSEKLIRQYSDVACFSEVVDSLPKGYESMIREKGVNLSGGQVQRLALTRGLLASHDKDIILLDEPTSSLDPMNALKVFKNIIERFKGQTIITSVHTLQVLPLFDRVFMFDGGKLVGAGTIPELLLTCPEFKELWDKQHTVTV